MLPNQDQIQSLIRQVLLVGSTYVISKGWLDQSTVTMLLPYVVGLVPVLWGLIIHRKAATVARAADIVPIPKDVQKSAGVTVPVLVPSRPKVI